MKKILAILTLSALAFCVQAKVRLPHMISDNMVLQQQTEVRLWGWAQPGKTVKVSTSWNHDAISTKADKQGKWLVKVRDLKGLCGLLLEFQTIASQLMLTKAVSRNST